MNARPADVELVVACRNELGESVLWDPRSEELLWVDISHGEIWRLDPASGDVRTHRLGERVGAIGLREGDGLVVGLASGFALYDLEREALERLEKIEPDLPTTRLNDGRVDRQGRFVCGGMDEGEPQSPLSAVYRLDPDRSTERILGEIHCANSTCFSPDGATMYFTNMPSRQILAYAYDADTGRPHDPRLFADLSDEPGLPDGSTVDADGCLWNAQWGGSRVVRYAPDGRIDRVMPVPAAHPTCLAFGGPDHATLYLTTARFGLTPEQRAADPDAGALYAIDAGVSGLPEPRFAG